MTTEAKLRERIRVLEAALVRHGIHVDACTPHRWLKGECLCGLKPILDTCGERAFPCECEDDEETP